MIGMVCVREPFALKALATAAVLTLLACCAASATVPARPRFALLIGNDTYGPSQPASSLPVNGDPSLPDLHNACSDVMAVGAQLERVGWKDEDITVKCDLTKPQLATEIESFLDRLQQSDEATAVFYFSGHGIEVAKKNYIFGTDARPDVGHAVDTYLRSANATLFGNDAIDVNWYLLGRIGETYNNAVLIVLDACRENPLLDELNRRLVQRIRSVNVQANPDWLVTALRVPDNPPDGIVTAFSTSNGDLAADGFGSVSPYADALTHKIRPSITIDQILNETMAQVHDQTRYTAREQRPDRRGFFRPPPRCFAGCIDEASQPDPSPSPAVKDGWLELPAIKEGWLDLKGTAAPTKVALRTGDIALDQPATRSSVVQVRFAQSNLSIELPEMRKSQILLDQSPLSLGKIVKDPATVTQLAVDVFWCSGDSLAQARWVRASEVASSIATTAKINPLIENAMVSRVAVKPIPLGSSSKRSFDPDSIVLEYSSSLPSNKKWAEVLQSSSIVPIRIQAADALNPKYPNYLSVYICQNLVQEKSTNRVFMQVADGSQVKLAQTINSGLASTGDFVVAESIEVQPVASHPDTEIRYFFEDDKPAAEKILGVVADNAKLPAHLVYLPSYQPKTSQGSFEIWLGSRLIFAHDDTTAKNLDTASEIIRVSDVSARDGQGNTVGRLSNIVLSLTGQSAKSDSAQSSFYSLKYSFYNGSGTQRGDQTVTLAFKGENDAIVAIDKFPLDRRRCIYGGPEVRFQNGVVPVAKEAIRNIDITITLVSGVQTPC
ncbi:caspase family protein [Bradyrhizobium sp. B097]|uniref:caspase family protein n=1 Tax=Bradyrhizobium sp. B097 TaxID=3140244 RepID=UPI0031841BDF